MPDSNVAIPVNLDVPLTTRSLPTVTVSSRSSIYPHNLSKIWSKTVFQIVDWSTDFLCVESSPAFISKEKAAAEPKEEAKAEKAAAEPKKETKAAKKAEAKKDDEPAADDAGKPAEEK